MKIQKIIFFLVLLSSVNCTFCQTYCPALQKILTKFNASFPKATNQHWDRLKPKDTSVTVMFDYPGKSGHTMLNLDTNGNVIDTVLISKPEVLPNKAMDYLKKNIVKDIVCVLY